MNMLIRFMRMVAVLSYSLYCVALGLSLLFALLLGSFHTAVEPDPDYRLMVVCGFLVGLGGNLGLLLAPTAARKGKRFRLVVAVGMLPAAAFLFKASLEAILYPLDLVVMGIYFIGTFAYGLGYVLLLRGLPARGV